jgi:hypothetical protein
LRAEGEGKSGAPPPKPPVEPEWARGRVSAIRASATCRARPGVALGLRRGRQRNAGGAAGAKGDRTHRLRVCTDKKDS